MQKKFQLVGAFFVACIGEEGIMGLMRIQNIEFNDGELILTARTKEEFMRKLDSVCDELIDLLDTLEEVEEGKMKEKAPKIANFISSL